MAERVPGLVGLAARAGAIIGGTERVREAVRDGQVKFAIVARDASANTRDKLLPLMAARGVTVVERFTRNALGEAIGRSPVSVIGVTEAALAERIRAVVSTGTAAPDAVPEG